MSAPLLKWAPDPKNCRPNEEFTVMLKRKLRLPLWPQQRLRCSCGRKMDAYGDHVMTCTKHSKTTMHNSMRNGLWKLPKKPWLVYWSRSMLILYLFLLTLFRCFGNTAGFETRLNRGFCRTCREDTLATKVSIQIWNDTFRESAHSLLTVRLRGSTVQSLVLFNSGVTKTFAECSPTTQKRLNSARELFATHYVVQSESENAYNSNIPPDSTCKVGISTHQDPVLEETSLHFAPASALLLCLRCLVSRVALNRIIRVVILAVLASLWALVGRVRRSISNQVNSEGSRVCNTLLYCTYLQSQYLHFSYWPHVPL